MSTRDFRSDQHEKKANWSAFQRPPSRVPLYSMESLIIGKNPLSLMVAAALTAKGVTWKGIDPHPPLGHSSKSFENLPFLFSENGRQLFLRLCPAAQPHLVEFEMEPSRNRSKCDLIRDIKNIATKTNWGLSDWSRSSFSDEAALALNFSKTVPISRITHDAIHLVDDTKVDGNHVFWCLELSALQQILKNSGESVISLNAKDKNVPGAIEIIKGPFVSPIFSTRSNQLPFIFDGDRMTAIRFSHTGPADFSSGSPSHFESFISSHPLSCEANPALLARFVAALNREICLHSPSLQSHDGSDRIIYHKLSPVEAPPSVAINRFPPHILYCGPEVGVPVTNEDVWGFEAALQNIQSSLVESGVWRAPSASN